MLHADRSRFDRHMVHRWQTAGGGTRPSQFRSREVVSHPSAERPCRLLRRRRRVRNHREVHRARRDDDDGRSGQLCGSVDGRGDDELSRLRRGDAAAARTDVGHGRDAEHSRELRTRVGPGSDACLTRSLESQVLALPRRSAAGSIPSVRRDPLPSAAPTPAATRSCCPRQTDPAIWWRG